MQNVKKQRDFYDPDRKNKKHSIHYYMISYQTLHRSPSHTNASGDFIRNK